VAALFVFFGIFGVVGNGVASRYVDRIGADRAILFALVLVALTLFAWPWATNVTRLVIVMVPWALAFFATVSLQQARLGAAAPLLAPALLALNTSAVYLGQAGGAASGGWLIANHGYGALSWTGLGWLVAAIALSVWAGRAHQRARR
jgi:predicted MFS family arabinose efflux permease